MLGSLYANYLTLKIDASEPQGFFCYVFRLFIEIMGLSTVNVKFSGICLDIIFLSYAIIQIDISVFQQPATSVSK